MIVEDLGWGGGRHGVDVFMVWRYVLCMGF